MESADKKKLLEEIDGAIEHLDKLIADGQAAKKILEERRRELTGQKRLA